MVKLPAFFGKNRSINLLPRDSFETSTLGVVLEWALAFGKWAVIVTQLVVMVTFLWRFGLDRRLTNTRREIGQEVAVIASYEALEEEFVLAQSSVKFANTTIERQAEIVELIGLLQSLTPRDVWYERFSLSPTTITVTAYSASLHGFGEYLASLQREPRFLNVNVASIEDGGGNGAQLAFNVTLTYREAKGRK